MNAFMHSCIYIFIYIAFYIHISLYHLYIISFMRFHQDLAIHVISIFLSCMLLLIHIFISYTFIFIYFPIHASTVRCLYIIFHILFHITYSVMPLLCLSFVYMCSFLLCHLLFISIILIIYAFLSCVPSMFHHIHFSMSIIYSYHIRCIYISCFIHFSFTFMFMFMFMFIYQFVFMFHIIFMFSCSSMNLLYLKIGIIPIDSSKFKLWHFHAN